MKKLTTASGVFGPYAHIETLTDRYRCDGADLPVSVVGIGAVVDVAAGDFPPPPAPALDRAAVGAQIDAEVDALYARVIGNRAAEYEQAEREALAYQGANFAGAAPPMVQVWATAKSWTGQQAAQDIITQATSWRGAQTQIRAQRLLRKEQVRTAADDAAVHAAVAAWGVALWQIKAALGVS